jgi:hypothetical protein
MSSIHFKRCYRCGVIKAFADFYRNASKADGLTDECKPCRVKASAEYEARHPERVKPRRRRYMREYMRRKRAAAKATAI